MPIITRRDLFRVGAIAAMSNAVQLSATPRTRKAGPAEAAWQSRSFRWIQVAFTEDDPGNYDPDFWLRYFQQIRAQGACLSAGGAIAFYPTDIPFQQRSSYLGTRDSFGEMVRGCRRLGMAVVGRIDPHSINEAAYAAHPEWAARLKDGSAMRHWADPSRYVTCAHGPYNFEFVPRIIREIVERYRVDAIFGNRWDGHTVCHCVSCQRLFRQATGFDIPETMDPADKIRRAYMVWENEHLFSLIDMWTAVIRRLEPNGFFMPGSSSRPQPHIEFDSRRLGAAPFLTVDRQGRAGNTPAWINGRNAKLHRAFMGTKPVANIFSIGLEEVFRWKDSVQSPAEIRLWLAEAIAQGFRPWLCKFNAKPFDKRWMPVVADVYQWHAANQRYLVGGENLARVAIVVSNQTTTFYGRRTQQNAEPDGAQYGYYHALIESRIPFEIVDDGFLEASSLARFRVLILPNIAALSDAQCGQLAEYVRLGGRIVATHETSLYDEWGVQRADFGLAELFGCSYAGRTEQNVRNSYLAIQPGHVLTRGLEDTPRIIGATGYVTVKPHDGEVASALKLIPSYPDLPMESVYPRDTLTQIPMAYCRDVGRGRVVYLPMDIDRCFWQVMSPDHRLVLRNALEWAADEESFVSVAGPGVLDIACWRQPDSITLHLVNLTNPMLLKGPFRELIPMGPYRVRWVLPPDVVFKRVRSLATGADLATNLRDRELTVEVPSVLLHEVLAIDL